MKRRSSLVLSLAREHWRPMAGSVTGTILVTAAELAHPFPLKIVLDQVLVPVAGASVGDNVWPILMAAGALALAVALVESAGNYWMEVKSRRVGENVTHQLRVEVYGRLQRLSLRYHDRQRPGDLVTRLTGDVGAGGELFAQSIPRLVSSGLIIVGMLVISLTLDPVLTLIAFVVMPPLTAVTVRFRRTLRNVSREQRALEGEIAAASEEALTSMRAVKALASGSFEEERFRRHSEMRQKAAMDAARVESRFGGVVDVLGAAGTAVVLVVGGLRVLAGAISPGDLVVFLSYVKRLYRPLREIARQSGRVSRAMARLERVGEVLLEDTDLVRDTPDAYQGGPAVGQVEVEDVTFTYRDDRLPALEGLSLRVRAGSCLAVVGLSGAGKSTLAALLTRFYDPDQGRVMLDGKDLRHCSLEWLRAQVGLVLQDSLLFSGTVADNIAYGADVDRSRVVAAARAARADEFIRELPQGYDTPLGSKAVALSGGQRRRLAMARTLVRDPCVLVLDEPTAGLDANSEKQVLESLRSLAAGRTTIIITHTLNVARQADNVVVLEAGRVVEQGDPEELLKGMGRFRNLASQQGLVPPPTFPTPVDPALPQIQTLLDPDAAADYLQGHIDGAGFLQGVKIRYLRYKPRTNLVVLYEVDTASGPAELVAMVASDRDLSKRASRPTSRTLASTAAPLAPVDQPLSYQPDLDVLLQWPPLDLWLPAWAKIDQIATSIPGARPGRSEILAYKPRRRATLRLDQFVVKLYRDPPAFEPAARALLSGRKLSVPTPPPSAILPDFLATAQPFLEGSVIRPGHDARSVGLLLADLHRTSLRPRTVRTAPDLLRAAAASARLVTVLHPPLTRPIDKLMARLEETTPTHPGQVASHGDFHSRQLLRVGADLVVLDLDEMCVAAPALDLANYAAHLHQGRPGDFEHCSQVLEELIAGYGARPDSLEWHLSVAVLARSPFPFRKDLDAEWPHRIEQMVEGALKVLR